MNQGACLARSRIRNIVAETAGGRGIGGVSGRGCVSNWQIQDFQERKEMALLKRMELAVRVFWALEENL
jgi:hypothetical protein